MKLKELQEALDTGHLGNARMNHLITRGSLMEAFRPIEIEGNPTEQYRQREIERFKSFWKRGGSGKANLKIFLNHVQDAIEDYEGANTG